MATKKETTATNNGVLADDSLESKTVMAIKTANELYQSLVPVYGTDAIQTKDSGSNDLLLGTRKLKVQVEIALGKDASVLPLDMLLPVTVSKQFDANTTVQQTIHLPVLQLLLAGSNGLFELYNTNPKDETGFKLLSTALTNGYFYPSSFEQANKKEPFSYANFIGLLNVMAEKQQLTPVQSAQWQAAKGKAPKVKELSSFLDLAFESDKWKWLAALMVANGYTKPVITDDMNDLL